jgi:hypothetical protein
MIDDENLHGTACGRQFQSQLLLYRGDDRRRSCRRGHPVRSWLSRLGRQLQCEVFKVKSWLPARPVRSTTERPSCRNNTPTRLARKHLDLSTRPVHEHQVSSGMTGGIFDSVGISAAGNRPLTRIPESENAFDLRQFCPQKPARPALLIAGSIALFLAGWLALWRALGRRLQPWRSRMCLLSGGGCFCGAGSRLRAGIFARPEPKTGHSPFGAGL